MRLRKPYKDTAEKDSILAEHAAAGNVLVEVQNHEDGDYLVFADEFPAQAPPPPSVDERLAVLEARLTALEKRP